MKAAISDQTVVGLRHLERLQELVCHARRAAEDVIRLISARKATKRERAAYARGWEP